MNDYLEIIGRSLAVYAVILILLRVGGRRELGQLTPFDLVFILLVANAVQNAMVGANVTLAGGLVSAATLFGANLIVSRLRLRSRRIRELVEGNPVVLVHDGEFVPGILSRENLDEQEVMAALREHGDVGDISHVALAVLEADGSISVVPISADVQRSHRRMRQRKQP